MAQGQIWHILSRNRPSMQNLNQNVTVFIQNLQNPNVSCFLFGKRMFLYRKAKPQATSYVSFLVVLVLAGKKCEHPRHPGTVGFARALGHLTLCAQTTLLGRENLG